MCEIHKARLLQPCSSGAPPTPMTGRYNFRRAWRPTPGQRPGTYLCVSRTSFLRLPGQFCLDRCCQSGNFLLRCNESRVVGLSVLILLFGGHQLLQNANDLAAPRKKTAWNDHHQKPCSSSQRLRQQKETSGNLTKRSWLLLPFTRACLLTTLTFRALHGNHIVTATLALYPRLF